MLNKQQESKVKQALVQDRNRVTIKSTLAAHVKPSTVAKAYLAGLSGISSYHIPGYN